MAEWGRDEGEPLRTRDPGGFARAEGRYRSGLTAFVRRRQRQGGGPEPRLDVLVEGLAQEKVCSSDVADLHMEAQRQALEGLPDLLKRVWLVEGRHFLLEVMGRLVDAYRAGVAG